MTCWNRDSRSNVHQKENFLKLLVERNKARKSREEDTPKKGKTAGALLQVLLL